MYACTVKPQLSKLFRGQINFYYEFLKIHISQDGGSLVACGNFNVTLTKTTGELSITITF